MSTESQYYATLQVICYPFEKKKLMIFRKSIRIQGNYCSELNMSGFFLFRLLEALD